MVEHLQRRLDVVGRCQFRRRQVWAVHVERDAPFVADRGGSWHRYLRRQLPLIASTIRAVDVLRVLGDIVSPRRIRRRYPRLDGGLSLHAVRALPGLQNSDLLVVLRGHEVLFGWREDLLDALTIMIYVPCKVNVDIVYLWF